VFFFDNTDPDGMDRVLEQLDGALNKTLVIVISKSGSTKETRNGMVEAELAYKAASLNFAKHAVAITGIGSQLDQYAEKNNWIQRFPMWDWVGGRTSELSGVGLLPAKLQGFDVKGVLAGAKSADILSRGKITAQNPSALLALAWFHATSGIGRKAMVVLPYKDRLELFSKYLQQLIMESLGKASDRDGKVVNQGIAVYGNKGATDQHSYIQQLRDGLNNYFAVFIEVLRDRIGASVPVQENITSGDYLSGFFQGTRQALFENNRESITITIDEVTPQAVGALIALFERAVGLYASLINVNAYHQPGVEAGKKAAETVIQIQQKILAFANQSAKAENTAEQIAHGISQPDEVETVFMVCRHLAANGKLVKVGQGGPSEAKFRKP
jgi:glucose-6-phosphate isomerase